jgi:hypothetical protein
VFFILKICECISPVSPRIVEVMKLGNLEQAEHLAELEMQIG